MDLAEIQHAIEELPKEQQAALTAWLAERDQAGWDAEIERDFSPGSGGIALLEEMKAEARAGHRSVSSPSARTRRLEKMDFPVTNSPFCA
jgi:hypothetical protein